MRSDLRFEYGFCAPLTALSRLGGQHWGDALSPSHSLVLQRHLLCPITMQACALHAHRRTRRFAIKLYGLWYAVAILPPYGHTTAAGWRRFLARRLYKEFVFKMNKQDVWNIAV